jgi:short-subunit dehydrogenase
MEHEGVTMWKERVIAITGAASGIGQALAVHLGRQGAILALSDIDESGLNARTEDLRSLGVECHSRVVDVSQASEIEAWCHEIIEVFGHVDGIINNAGVSVIDGAEFVSNEDFEWVMGINFWGVIYGTQIFLPHLRKRPEAYVVNISSLFGLIGVPTQAAYNASKFAVRGYTEALRQELHGTNVHVACVHPGGIRTNITRNARHHLREGLTFPKERLVKVFENHLAKVTPDEAAAMIVQGMVSKRKRILIGKDARLFDLVARIFPSGYDALIRRFNRRPKS